MTSVGGPNHVERALAEPVSGGIAPVVQTLPKPPARATDVVAQAGSGAPVEQQTHRAGDPFAPDVAARAEMIARDLPAGVAGEALIDAAASAPTLPGSAAARPVATQADELSATSMQQQYEAMQPLLDRAVLDIFGDPKKRDEFWGFFRAVFPAFNDAPLHELLDDIIKNHPNDPAKIRSELFARRAEALPNELVRNLRMRKAADVQNAHLGGHLQALLFDVKRIDGWLDIGNPGCTMRQLKDIEIVGPKIGLDEKPQSLMGKIAQRIKAGSLLRRLPVDRIIPYSNKPIAKTDIPDGTLDLVTCDIGLHHHPVSKLHPFVQRIFEMVRPGGSFVLRDHDAATPHGKQLAALAHMMFNVGMQISEADDAAEYRFVNSMDFWTKLLESHGFVRVNDVPKMIDGDSSGNAMVRFYKPKSAADAEVVKLRARAREDATYVRPDSQTWLTTVEWADVDVSKQIGAFAKDKPLSSYPYFRTALMYWTVLAKSVRASSSVPLGYLAMNTFIPVAQSLSYTARGIASLPTWIPDQIGRWLGTKPSIVQQQAAHQASEYAAFLDHTPWYLYDWKNERTKMWTAFRDGFAARRTTQGVFAFINPSTWRDLGTCVGKSISHTVSAATAAPIAKQFQSAELKEPDVIGMIIRDPSGRLAELKQGFAAANDGKDFVIKASQGAHHYVSVPRYVPFNNFLTKAAALGIAPVEIAGNDTIQLQVTVDRGREASLAHIVGTELRFHFNLPGRPSCNEVGLAVKTDRIPSVLPYLAKNPNVAIKRFHDF